MIKRLVPILLALNLYKAEFEALLLEQTQEYYKTQLLKSDENLSNYLVKVEAALESEQALVRECLDVSTLEKVSRVV